MYIVYVYRVLHKTDVFVVYLCIIMYVMYYNIFCNPIKWSHFKIVFSRKDNRTFGFFSIPKIFCPPPDINNQFPTKKKKDSIANHKFEKNLG